MTDTWPIIPLWSGEGSVPRGLHLLLAGEFYSGRLPHTRDHHEPVLLPRSAALAALPPHTIVATCDRQVLCAGIDGTWMAVASVDQNDSAWVEVAAVDEVTADAVFVALRGAIPKVPEGPDDEDDFWFWSASNFAPKRRRLRTVKFEDIARNYTASVQDVMGGLVAMTSPPSVGKLVILVGPPEPARRISYEVWPVLGGRGVGLRWPLMSCECCPSSPTWTV